MIIFLPVGSMIGVLLIARPSFLFGETHSDEDGVTAAQRMTGVLCVPPIPYFDCYLHDSISLSLVCVLGATCVCK
jgi:hypothetical protein